MAPEEGAGTCYFIFLMYGIGVLLPWNVILSCLDFLMEEVRSQMLNDVLTRCKAIVLRQFTHSL